jgi:hypothetical protein
VIVLASSNGPPKDESYADVVWCEGITALQFAFGGFEWTELIENASWNEVTALAVAAVACSAQCAVGIVQCAVCIVQCAVGIVQCAVSIVQCAMCIVQCAVCSVYSFYSCSRSLKNRWSTVVTFWRKYRKFRCVNFLVILTAANIATLRKVYVTLRYRTITQSV